MTEPESESDFDAECESEPEPESGQDAECKSQVHAWITHGGLELGISPSRQRS